MKKLKAFTVMELIVGMVISTLLMGICFMAYKAVLKQFTNFKENNAAIQEITLTHYLLTKDTDKASKIYLKDESTLAFEFEAQPPTYYTFEEKYIIRESSIVIDTLNVSVSGTNFTLLDQSPQHSTQKILVLGISLLIGKGDGQLELNVNKDYDASQTITQQ